MKVRVSVDFDGTLGTYKSIQKYVKELGVNKYIIKPYNLEAIKDTISKTMLSFK